MSWLQDGDLRLLLVRQLVGEVFLAGGVLCVRLARGERSEGRREDTAVRQAWPRTLPPHIHTGDTTQPRTGELQK